MAISVAVTTFIIYKSKYSKTKDNRDRAELPEHIYEVPERCFNVDPEVNSLHTGTMRYTEEPTASNNHGNYAVEEDSQRSSDDQMDDVSSQDYRGYELPSYIATISNNYNGPPNVRKDNSYGKNGVANVDAQDRRMAATIQQDPPVYLTMDDSGVVDCYAADDYQIPNCAPVDIQEAGVSRESIDVWGTSWQLYLRSRGGGVNWTLYPCTSVRGY